MFRKELEELINKHSLENGSDTPDFILAKYLEGCLENFDQAVRDREQWYGRKIENNLETSNSLPLEEVKVSVKY